MKVKKNSQIEFLCSEAFLVCLQEPPERPGTAVVDDLDFTRLCIRHSLEVSITLLAAKLVGGLFRPHPRAPNHCSSCCVCPRGGSETRRGLFTNL
jgi:hypothetical protein